MSITDRERQILRDIKKMMDEDYARRFLEAYTTTGGNISKLALGLGYSRNYIYSYLRITYGDSFKVDIMKGVNSGSAGNE